LSPLCGYGNTEPRLEDTGRRSDGQKLSLAYYTKGAQPKTLSSKLGKSIAQWGAGDLNQPPVRAAFEKMLATGTAAHHTEHVLGALLFETEWETARAVEAGKDTERVGAFTSANFKNSPGIRPSAKNSRGSSRPIILRLNRGTPRRKCRNPLFRLALNRSRRNGFYILKSCQKCRLGSR